MSKGKPYVDVRGYNEGVTGSCIRNTVHFADGTTYRYLVDYGMYQGEGHKRGIDYNDSVNPNKINTILVTHPHLDHDGALPIFVKKGYTGKIYMTDAAACLIDIGFNDSYNIMKKDAKLLRQAPLYSEEDVSQTLRQVKAVKFEEPIKNHEIHDYITVTFFNNGHLFGSSIILVQINEPGHEPINLLYTGDYKPYNIFLDIQPLPSWVYALPNLTIISEATYGTTNSWDIVPHLDDDIVEACAKNKTIVLFAFAQGRYQEMLYRVAKLKDQGKIPEDYPVRADGKTGIDYTFRQISNSNIIKYKEGMTHFFPSHLQFVDDKTRPSIMQHKGGQIIITTSGMGTNGPARVYAPYYLRNKNAILYFPGYLSEGTIGRRLYEAGYGETVTIHGEPVVKQAEVLQTLECSSHATADELIEFYSMFAPKSILFIHGSIDKKKALEARTRNELGIKKTGILGMGYVCRINSYGIDKKVEK